jgi:SSS family solute:Na+ symporter
LSEGKQVLFGRIFVMTLLALAFSLAMVTSGSIFSVGVWSLSGFAGLFPVVVAALYWRRSTAAGVITAIVTVAALWLVCFLLGLDSPGEYTLGGSGIMPVALLFAGAGVSVVVVSLVTRPPDEHVIARFFP